MVRVLYLAFRLLVKFATALALLWALIAGALFAIMWLPPGQFAGWIGALPRPLMIVPMALMPFETMWNVARGGALRTGDPAPDFDLPRQDGSGRVKLSSHFGQRPVLLVFGSYT